MGLRPRLVVTVGLVVCLVACGGSWTTPSLRERLDLHWSPDQEWSVRVRFWAERLADPYSARRDPTTVTWHYHPCPALGGRDLYAVCQSGNDRLHLLMFDRSFNLQHVLRVLDPDRPQVVKTKSVRVNRFGGSIFFYRAGSSHPPVFWFHPDLSVRSLGEPLRRNVLRAGRPSGDWVHQRVQRRRDRYVIRIWHRPTDTLVRFVWPRGDPWWSTAEWFVNERIVARADRMSPHER